MACWLGAIFQLGATFGTGFTALTIRAIASGGVVLTKRPHIRGTYRATPGLQSSSLFSLLAMLVLHMFSFLHLAYGVEP